MRHPRAEAEGLADVDIELEMRRWVRIPAASLAVVSAPEAQQSAPPPPTLQAQPQTSLGYSLGPSPVDDRG